MSYNHDNYTHTQHIIKRITDIILSTLLLLISIPVVVFPVLWILFHSRVPLFSPIVYSGLGGTPFRSFCLCAVPSSATTGSPSSSSSPVRRVITALPLLVNVVLGDMSLTGPKLYTQSELIPLKSSHPDIRVLLGVRPGLISASGTYLDHVMGQIDIGRQIDIDIRYVENRTLRVDIQMLADSLLSLFMA